MKNKKNKKIKKTVTSIFLDILTPPLPMSSPIGDTVTDTCTTFVIGAVLERVAHNLDPELPVREVTIVESEREISICRSRYTTSGELRFHPRSRVKQIRTRFQVPHPLSLSLPDQEQTTKRK